MAPKAKRYVRFFESEKQEELVKLVSRLFGKNWNDVIENLGIDYHPKTFGTLWMQVRRNLPENVFRVFLTKLFDESTVIHDCALEYEKKIEYNDRIFPHTPPIK